MLQTTRLLGVKITSENSKNILEYVLKQVRSGSEKLFITTPNPEILVYASKHSDYKDKLNSSDVALPDGVGLVMGGYLLGKRLQERITGVDFIEMLCKKSKENPMSMGFLGGRGGVAELTAERLKKKYPWIKVSWVGEEWGKGKNDTVRHTFPTVNRRLEKSIDILFVAYGFPKQEEWIYENLPKLPVKAAMGVGGAFDYLSGKVPRAPKFIRVLGLEWFFRLLVQPWRFKRQLSLFSFLSLIVKEKFKKKN